MSVVCHALTGAKLLRSRNPSGSGNFKPCIRDRHRTRKVCLGCTRRLMRRNSTCCYFYGGRRLRNVGHIITKGRVSVCSGHYLGLSGRRMRHHLSTKRPRMVHFGVPARKAAAFRSMVCKSVAMGGRRLRSLVLVGSSKCPACGFTGMVSSRLVRVARMMENGRCLSSTPGCGHVCRTFK